MSCSTVLHVWFAKTPADRGPGLPIRMPPHAYPIQNGEHAETAGSVVVQRRDARTATVIRLSSRHPWKSPDMPCTEAHPDPGNGCCKTGGSGIRLFGKLTNG